MKLHHLTISNFLGARDVQIDMATPVTLVCGPNGSGKSSVRDALDLALTGALHRVALKKDAGALVTEGAQKARISVAGPGLAVEVAISAAGKLARSGASVDALPALLPYVLDGQRFARGLTADGRRQFLFGLMGVKVDVSSIKAKLAARGCDTGRAAQVLPALRGGFEAAHSEAKSRATQARGAWKAVTGETYGSQKAERAHEAALRKTAEAAAHHADVQALEQIAEALSPSGIPAELLAEALTPLNDALAGHAESAQWPRVEVTADMVIRTGLHERPYSLLSESEQWRADAMLAAAIAQLSGLRLLVLDRMDVLDLPGRGDLIAWLDDLAQAGDIDTAMVFGTLKALPSGLPETVAAVWIDCGNAATHQPLQAAA